MKNKYVLIILTSIILGIFIGMIIRENKNENDIYINKDKLNKNEISSIKKQIKKLHNQKEKYEIELNDLITKYETKEEIEEIEILKRDLSYDDINGNGIIIEMDAMSDAVGNIANLVDYNKVLLKIINEIKLYGGKFIAINEQRINQYSEVILAGNHININSISIAPPYEIKVIGDEHDLTKYIDKKNSYLYSIESNYLIKIRIKSKQNITMKKMNVPNNLEYIKGD